MVKNTYESGNRAGSELETRVREAAARDGQDAAAFVTAAVEEKLLKDAGAAATPPLYGIPGQAVGVRPLYEGSLKPGNSSVLSPKAGMGVPMRASIPR